MLSPQSHRPHARAILRYAAGWLVAGLAVVRVAFGLFRLGREEEVSLPPVRQTELAEAAVSAGCELKGNHPANPLGPPVEGPRAAPARPGVYARPIGSRELVGAIRMGVIVIHYRPPSPRTDSSNSRSCKRRSPSGPS